ncbi:hypothetical protein HanPSC8_Chr06g0237241 [Helianthus annuus]|nr:hypothetical protein HanPSC8_Chr06g0237241 [Helianthus annuus]
MEEVQQQQPNGSVGQDGETEIAPNGSSETHGEPPQNGSVPEHLDLRFELGCVDPKHFLSKLLKLFVNEDLNF